MFSRSRESLYRGVSETWEVIKRTERRHTSDGPPTESRRLHGPRFISWGPTAWIRCISPVNVDTKSIHFILDDLKSFSSIVSHLAYWKYWWYKRSSLQLLEKDKGLSLIQSETPVYQRLRWWVKTQDALFVGPVVRFFTRTGWGSLLNKCFCPGTCLSCVPGLKRLWTRSRDQELETKCDLGDPF